MVMILSILAEVVIFCNRDARNDALYKAVDFFSKGIIQCKNLAMPPITKQVLVQVDRKKFNDKKALQEITDKIKTILKDMPEITVVAFFIPQVSTKIFNI